MKKEEVVSKNEKMKKELKMLKEIVEGLVEKEEKKEERRKREREEWGGLKQGRAQVIEEIKREKGKVEDIKQ